MQSDAKNVEISSKVKPSMISGFAAAVRALWMADVTCSCGACAVDGGHDYLRRCGNLGDWEELSEAEKVENNGALT